MKNKQIKFLINALKTGEEIKSTSNNSFMVNNVIIFALEKNTRWNILAKEITRVGSQYIGKKIIVYVDNKQEFNKALDKINWVCDIVIKR